MAIYGYFRADVLADDKGRECLATALAEKALALGETPAAIYIGDEGHGAADLAGILKPGDTLILPQLADLGASIADLAANIQALGDRGVRVYAIRASGGDLDLAPEAGATLLKIVALWGETERAIRSRRSSTVDLRKLR